MSNITYASIIPLIGGMTLAQHESLGKPPDFLMTYEGFQDNEKHLLHHYRTEHGIDLPYHYIDRGERPSSRPVIVNTTCPCAGLSLLSTTRGPDNAHNQWMRKTADYILGELQPDVLWGENAPTFATDLGTPVREYVRRVGAENGYTMSTYQTKSVLHGTPQIRDRAFYFLWKGDRVPMLEWYDRGYQDLGDLLRNANGNFQGEPINTKTPSKDDPYYRYILEDTYKGISHREFVHEELPKISDRSMDTNDVVRTTTSHGQLGAWLTANGYEREAKKAIRAQGKIDDDKGIMRRGTLLPHRYMGAFISHGPVCLTHPDQDRYITYREAMAMMGLPPTFELLDPYRSMNHICQNVPVNTARDMANEVVAVLEGKREMLNATYIQQDNRTRRVRKLDSRHVDITQQFMGV